MEATLFQIQVERQLESSSLRMKNRTEILIRNGRNGYTETYFHAFLDVLGRILLCLSDSSLIPNLSYISEAAACLLDRQLQTYIVPYTEVVWFSSKAFNYDWFDRRAYYRKGKPLPQKCGSFQVFLDGFRDANLFLRENPWPDRYNSSFNTEVAPKKTKWTAMCLTGATGDDLEAQNDAPENSNPTQDPSPRFQWTEALQQNFREELEKLVILDYMMRNTGTSIFHLA